MNDRQNPVWVDRAIHLLDESTRDLDAATLSRLNRARQTALDLARPRRARPWMLSAMASACACAVLAVAVWLPQRGDDSAPTALGASAATDNGDEVSLDFYQNLDFYAWLDAQAKNDTDEDDH